MNRDRKRLWLAVRLVLYGAMLLLALAVALPSFVQARWASCGVPVVFQVSVADTQTGEPVPGAKVLHWTEWDEKWFHLEGSGAANSAATCARGTCQVHSHLPGSGSGRKGRLKANWTIWVRAEGYEPWQSPVSALLGSSVSVSNPFQTNAFPVKVMLTRK